MEDPREVQVGKKIPVGQSVGPDSFNGHISPLWWTFVLGRDLPSLTAHDGYDVKQEEWRRGEHHGLP